ncbi:FACT complex subunit SSRP1-B-like isoform X1 [Phragmites australis]|uniref:FACT complex subunit SSRP1-B-like isoform X1 n=2 Tax=Phragmites australis TaxID=29695 RepID=UPI002D78B23E|nr:FACT complex subunit SSRP1-B-like isoform X1 [Phragmites australis]
MTDVHHFNNISLGGRGIGYPGQFKLYSGGLAWKKHGGGKIIEVDKADITSVTWMKIPRSYQLDVGTKEGLFYRFFGFREQDVSNLTNFIQRSMGISPEEKQLSISGHNWGGVEINGNRLCFNVGANEAFEVSLADVSQTQMQGKTDVVLEFHVDDTTRANEKDSLMDVSFHVPTSNTQFIGDEHRTSAQMLLEVISDKIGGSGPEAAVVTFDGIAILTPRGRYSIELHQSFLRLQGQATDFKIQYSSILRLFVLPKSHNPHTFVVITLDPPIRKGQTLYPHIVIQFETEAVVERDLTLSEEVLAEKYKDRLESSYRGLIHEVFSKVLRGLSGAKVTRPSTFRSCQDGYAVKSSLKAEDGLLYPLEKGFFFLPKPPTLILHEEIEYVEFERHGAGGASMSSQYFDLLVKLKNGQEHLFRNIQRNEYHNLFNFISGKHLKILNLGDGQVRTGGVAAVLQSTDDDSVDPHLERIKNQAGDGESDEEDEDFVADKDDSGSPSDDSDEGGSDASLSGGEKEKPSKKEASSSKPPVKRKHKSGADEGSEKRKPKKKKDPNAPKRAIAPFMYFSKAERANIKSSNPELATTEIAKKLGERWQKMTAEERQPYVEQSQVDKQRYAEESAAYRSAAAPGSGDGSA